MQLSHYLTPREIIIPLKGTSKNAIYEELVSYLADINKITDKKRLLEAIMERESSASTFLPMGIAIPHARIPDINDITVVMGISPTEIKDTAKGGPDFTANVFILFFSPAEEKELGRHLKLLARIAAVFSDAKLVPELARMNSAEDVFELLQRRERDISEE